MFHLLMPWKIIRKANGRISSQISALQNSELTPYICEIQTEGWGLIQYSSSSGSIIFRPFSTRLSTEYLQCDMSFSMFESVSLKSSSCSIRSCIVHVVLYFVSPSRKLMTSDIFSGPRESSLLRRLERGREIGLQAMQETKALISR